MHIHTFSPKLLRPPVVMATYPVSRLDLLPVDLFVDLVLGHHTLARQLDVDAAGVRRLHVNLGPLVRINLRLKTHNMSSRSMDRCNAVFAGLC